MVAEVDLYTLITKQGGLDLIKQTNRHTNIKNAIIIPLSRGDTNDTPYTGWLLKNGPPFHIGFELILIVLAKSDEQMPYWLGFGDSFAIFYIAVTCLVQELC